MCVLCAAPPAAVGPVQQQLQGEEERRAGPAGPGAGRRLQGRRGPRASRKAAGPLHEPVLGFVGFFFVFFLAFDAGVLLQECCSSHAGMWYLKGTIESWRWAAVPSCTHHPPPPPGWEGSQVDDSQSQLGQPEGQWSVPLKTSGFFFFPRGKKKSPDVERVWQESVFQLNFWICAVMFDCSQILLPNQNIVFFHCTPDPSLTNLI